MPPGGVAACRKCALFRSVRVGGAACRVEGTERPDGPALPTEASPSLGNVALTRAYLRAIAVLSCQLIHIRCTVEVPPVFNYEPRWSYPASCPY